jgi:hypothetical protein
MLLHDRTQQPPFLGYQQDKNGGPSFINMAGSHRTSVLLPLSDSSLMWFVHTCYCRESADASNRFKRVLAADIWKVVSRVYDTPKFKLKRCHSTLTTLPLWRHRHGSCTFPSATGTTPAHSDCEIFRCSSSCRN